PRALARCPPTAHRGDTRGELRLPRREGFGDVIQDLGAHMARRLRPARRGVGRLYCVADVLAVPFPHLSDDLAVRSDDLAAVGLVGPDLFAANEELGGPVNIGEWGGGMWGSGRSAAGRRAGPLDRHRDAHVPTPHAFSPRRFEVLPHPLPPPLAPESRLAL